MIEEFIQALTTTVQQSLIKLSKGFTLNMQQPDQQTNTKIKSSTHMPSIHNRVERSPAILNNSKYYGKSYSPLTIVGTTCNPYMNEGQPQRNIAFEHQDKNLSPFPMNRYIAQRTDKQQKFSTSNDLKALCEEQKLTIAIWKSKCEEKDKKLIRYELLIVQLQHKVMSGNQSRDNHKNQLTNQQSFGNLDLQEQENSTNKLQGIKNNKSMVTKMLQHQVRQLKTLLKETNHELQNAIESTKDQCFSLFKEAMIKKDNLIQDLSDVFYMQLKNKNEKQSKLLIKSDLVQIENARLEMINEEITFKIEEFLKQ